MDSAGGTDRQRTLTDTTVEKKSPLNSGEAEAIALASFPKHFLLVDDKEGRAVAAMLNIFHIGTAGVLLEAYFKG